MFPNGDVYEGSFYQNTMHGRGNMTYEAGGSYDGMWQNGIK